METIVIGRSHGIGWDAEMRNFRVGNSLIVYDQHGWSKPHPVNFRLIENITQVQTLIKWDMMSLGKIKITAENIRPLTDVEEDILLEKMFS